MRKDYGSLYAEMTDSIIAQLEQGRLPWDSGKAIFRAATTQVYLHAHLAFKEAALAKVKPFKGQKEGRYKPGDRLLAFLDAL